MNVLSLPQPTPTLCVTHQWTDPIEYRGWAEHVGQYTPPPMVQWIVPLDQPAPPEAIGTRIALRSDETEPKHNLKVGHHLVHEGPHAGTWLLSDLSIQSAAGLIGVQRLPLGVIVGSATIQTCLPIVDYETWWDMEPGDSSTIAIIGDQLRLSDPEDGSTDISDQLPYGDYRPGRYAWILSDAAPCTERCPACDGLGGDESTGTPHGPDLPCPACGGTGRREPIPWTPPNPQQLTQWTPT